MAGTWSCTGAAAGYYPTEDLLQIVRLARLYAPMALEALVVDHAATCALAHGAYGGTADEHCEYVLAAREHATAGLWSDCIFALKHLGTVTPGAAVAPATTWPCTSACDADANLFTVIALANFNAPAAKRGAVIDKAVTCGLDHDAASGTHYSTEAEHCTWVNKAQGHAEGENWNLCIEALDHTGGGEAPAENDDYEVSMQELIDEVREMLRRWRRRWRRRGEND